MDYHSIIIINPSDEKPHCISGSKVHVKYQHGNVTIKCKFKMSFVLVFRVVQRYELYNVMNNMSITNTEKFMDINALKHKRRQEIYMKFDYKKYHIMMKQMYCDMKNTIKEL